MFTWEEFSCPCSHCQPWTKLLVKTCCSNCNNSPNKNFKGRTLHEWRIKNLIIFISFCMVESPLDNVSLVLFNFGVHSGSCSLQLKVNVNHVECNRNNQNKHDKSIWFLLFFLNFFFSFSLFLFKNSPPKVVFFLIKITGLFLVEWIWRIWIFRVCISIAIFGVSVRCVGCCIWVGGSFIKWVWIILAPRIGPWRRSWLKWRLV
jgi:hypothetical protein